MTLIEVALLAIVLGLVALCCITTYMFHVEQKKARQERDDLLNRIMARDFTQYVQGTRAVAAANLEDYMRNAKPPEEEDEAEPPDDGKGMPVL